MRKVRPRRCPTCGHEFLPSIYSSGIQKFCSVKCRSQHSDTRYKNMMSLRELYKRRRAIKHPCKGCSKLISSTRAFCSQQCAVDNRRTARPDRACIICGATFKPFRNANVYCSDACRERRVFTKLCCNCGTRFKGRRRVKTCSPECAATQKSINGKSARSPEKAMARRARALSRLKLIKCCNCGTHFPVPKTILLNNTIGQRPRKYCSPECESVGRKRSLRLTDTPARKQRRLQLVAEHNKRRWAKPEEHTKVSAMNKERWQTNPEYVKKITHAASEWLKRQWRDPVFYAKQSERCAEQFKKLANDPKNRKNTSERAKRIDLLAKTAEILLREQGEQLELYTPPLWFWEYPAYFPRAWQRRRWALARLGEQLTNQYGVTL